MKSKHTYMILIKMKVTIQSNQLSIEFKNKRYLQE